MNAPRPHDLLWLQDRNVLEDVSEEWVINQWRPTLPVVVRRDVSPDGRIPVGVRGMRREQRAAGWAHAAGVKRVVSPEALALACRAGEFSFCFYAAGAGGNPAFVTQVAMGLGRYRQRGLRAGDGGTGAACEQRSRSADPLPAARCARCAGGVAAGYQPAAMPRRYANRNARRGLRAGRMAAGRTRAA